MIPESSAAAEGGPVIAFYAYTHDVGPDESLVRGVDRDTIRQLPSALAELLVHCDRFRTIAEHVEHARRFGWREEAPGEIASGLNRLAAEGLLIGPRAFLDRLGGSHGHAGSEPPGQRAISTVAWTTRSRSSSLRRGMTSLAENLAMHGRECRLAVCDDSDTPEAAEATLRVLEEVRTTTRRQVLYAGPGEKERFAARLSDALADVGIGRAVVDFALCDVHRVGRSYGVSRNTIRLATDGEMVLALDDDVECRPVASLSPAGPRLAISSVYDPTELTLYPDRETVLAAVAAEPVDVLGVHETILGQFVGAVIRKVAPSGEVDLDDANAGLVATLSLRPARVAVSTSGIYGDVAFASPRHLLSRRRRVGGGTLESESSYRAALAGRQMWRRLSRHVVSGSHFFMAGASGLDHRAHLPPYFPVLRGEDGLFAFTLRTCAPEEMIGYVPVSLYHNPPDFRSFDPRGATIFSFSLLEMIHILTNRLGGGLFSEEPEARQRSLGRLFLSFASADAAGFGTRLSEALLLALQRQVAELEDVLDLHGGEPWYWARDIEALAESARRYGASDELVVPGDLRAGRSQRDAFELTRTVICEYGELLVSWPGILAASRYLHQTGHPLLREL